MGGMWWNLPESNGRVGSRQLRILKELGENIGNNTCRHRRSHFSTGAEEGVVDLIRYQENREVPRIMNVFPKKSSLYKVFQ